MLTYEVVSLSLAYLMLGIITIGALWRFPVFTLSTLILLCALIFVAEP